MMPSMTAFIMWWCWETSFGKFLAPIALALQFVSVTRCAMGFIYLLAKRDHLRILRISARPFGLFLEKKPRADPTN